MGTLEASHTVEIEAPLERVYEVAADVANCDKWTPSVLEVEVIEKHPDGSAKLVEMENDALVKKTKTIDDGRTRAVYTLRTDPGRVLGLLLRGPVEGKVKEFLSKGAAEGLKEYVEANG
jgi:hypothetical protein